MHYSLQLNRCLFLLLFLEGSKQKKRQTDFVATNSTNNTMLASQPTNSTSSNSETLSLEQLYQDILEARKKIGPLIHHTPMVKSDTFSKMTESTVYLKEENLQKTGSFKARGALNACANLSEEQRQRGVICASSGNHAQGVAYSAHRLGISATVLMPKVTPIAKINATKGYHANVVIHGEVFDEALAKAVEVSKQENAPIFISPFNDRYVIAGQGTIGLEIMEDVPDADILVIPVGGGGLSCGIACAAKKMNPKLKVYGVEAESCPSMLQSLDQGFITGPTNISTICDGISVKRPGTITFPLAQQLLDGVVTVDDFEVSKVRLI